MWTESGCDEYMHECCMSPFTDSTTPTYLTYTKTTSDEDIDNTDGDTEAVVSAHILQSSIERLNSPPSNQRENQQYVYSKSEYTHLIWVIRNNA